MFRAFAGLLLVTLGSVAVLGQAPAPAPAFDVADVHDETHSVWHHTAHVRLNLDDAHRSPSRRTS